jgi:hypothetical protein
MNSWRSPQWIGDTSRISSRISSGTVGRPPRCLDFQRQYDLKPARCQRITVSGFKIARAPRTLGAKRYSPANINRSKVLKFSRFGD